MMKRTERNKEEGIRNKEQSRIATLIIFSLLLTPYSFPLIASVPETLSMVGTTLDAARVYPNPWRADKHTVNQITFDQLPTMTTVKIFSLAGQFVKALDAETGTTAWDLTNDAGDKVASGLYLYVLLTDDGQEFKGKLAVIK